jgi:hypothetical protein
MNPINADGEDLHSSHLKDEDCDEQLLHGAVCDTSDTDAKNAISRYLREKSIFHFDIVSTRIATASEQTSLKLSFGQISAYR